MRSEMMENSPPNPVNNILRKQLLLSHSIGLVEKLQTELNWASESRASRMKCNEGEVTP